nr:hypothetical protein Iba_chr08aCG12300 [Ipomoea batatas]
MGVDLPDLPGEDDPRAAAVRFGFGFDTSGEDINSRLQLPWMTLQWRRALATLFLCIVSRPSPTNHSGFRHRLTSSGTKLFFCSKLQPKQLPSPWYLSVNMFSFISCSSKLISFVDLIP